jgi:glucose/arabinose dehydrogenase
MNRTLIALFATAALSVAQEPAPDLVDLVPAWPNLTLDKPMELVVAPDGTGRQFLVQQRGLVLLLPADESSKDAKTFLDLTTVGMEAKNALFEEGLMSLAFHPKFKDNGKLYICHSAQEPKRSVYAEYQVSKSDPDTVDISTRRVLLDVPQPFWNHHSGNMVFGPDGYLYLSLGDGGGKGGDPLRHAQNTFIMQAKVLRIDVDHQQGSRGYAIPADNPFVGQEGFREEVWAHGFRNPWGLAFDGEGNLWLADVGQDLYEEINLVQKGGNYGWSFREGAQNFPMRTDAAPEGTTFVDPIHVYDHTQGISITGGFVYQGSKLAAHKGQYLYADWAFGTLWALKYDSAAKKVASNTVLRGPKFSGVGKNGKPIYTMKPAAICEDKDHEIIVLDWLGKAWHVVAKN